MPALPSPSGPPRICGLRPGTPHEPHGACLGTAPEYPSERVMTSAEAAALSGERLNGSQR